MRFRTLHSIRERADEINSVAVRDLFSGGEYRGWQSQFLAQVVHPAGPGTGIEDDAGDRPAREFAANLLGRGSNAAEVRRAHGRLIPRQHTVAFAGIDGENRGGSTVDNIVK